MVTTVTRWVSHGENLNLAPAGACDVDSRLTLRLVDVPNVSPGPMKEKDLRPGTVFPVLGTLLFFLPERYKEKLCCATALASEVSCSLHVCSPGCPLTSSPSPAQGRPGQALPDRPDGRRVCQRGRERRRRSANQDRSFLGPDSAPRGPGDGPVSPPEPVGAAGDIRQQVPGGGGASDPGFHRPNTFFSCSLMMSPQLLSTENCFFL